jgi:hypothetical protein
MNDKSIKLSWRDIGIVTVRVVYECVNLVWKACLVGIGFAYGVLACIGWVS